MLSPKRSLSPALVSQPRGNALGKDVPTENVALQANGTFRRIRGLEEIEFLSYRAHIKSNTL